MMVAHSGGVINDGVNYSLALATWQAFKASVWKQNKQKSATKIPPFACSTRHPRTLDN